MEPKTDGDKQFNFLLGEEDLEDLHEKQVEQEQEKPTPDPTQPPAPEGEYHEPPILHPPPVDVLGTDPREDMNERYEDGELWVRLMQYAKNEHTQFLAGLFHYLRSMGAALICQRSSEDPLIGSIPACTRGTGPGEGWSLSAGRTPAAQNVQRV